jgi:hypothetical protein
VFTSWPLYALLVVGVLSIVIKQLTYRAGPLRLSLPIITTIDPITGLLIGVALFDDRLRDGPLALSGEAIGLALVVAAAIMLTRAEPELVAPAV